MLTIDHLEKCFGSTVLFRDLTFTVDGPAVLWAPSGWGKTTLLRILMGLEVPTPPWTSSGWTTTGRGSRRCTTWAGRWRKSAWQPCGHF